MILRNKLRLFWQCSFTYCTELSVLECIHAISCEPKTFGNNPLNLECYESEKLSENQLRLTFKGGQYGGFVRTEYLADFILQNGGTKIILQFQKEIWGFFPMTSTHHLDIFMQQKVKAYNIRQTEYRIQ